MAYLYCPHCDRTAWLDASTEPPLVCRHCHAELAPMPERRASSLTAAVRQRFVRDMRLDASRPRFVRG